MVRYLFYTIGDLTYQSPLVNLPTLSDSTKQVPLRFIRDLDQYFNLRHLTNCAYF